MRRIDEIIVHCTASPEGREMTVKQISGKTFLLHGKTFGKTNLSKRVQICPSMSKQTAWVKHYYHVTERL